MIASIDNLRMESAQEPDYHEPVLLEKVLEYLRPGEGKVFFDATLGGGGHAQAMLERGASVLGCDRDPDAIAAVQSRLAPFGTRCQVVHANYTEARAAFPQYGDRSLDGVLMDLGVSSHQLETAERGFSFQQDGPLDMRMDPTRGQTAAELLNGSAPEELVRILWEYGEESASRRVAAALVRRRQRAPFQTTGDLVEALQAVLPRRGPRHPATRVFQALRLAVNDELGGLRDGLETLSGWLRPGGRMAVITFHSLEDRIVKHRFREISREWLDRPEWPEPRPNPEFAFHLVTARPVEPDSAELRCNPRSRSARLRVIERLPL